MIVLVGLIMTSMCDGCEDLENMIKEMDLEMKERLAFTEEMLMKNNQDVKETIAALGKTKEELTNIREEMIDLKSQNVQMAFDLEKQMDHQRITIEELVSKAAVLKKVESDISSLKEPPFLHDCGAHYDDHGLSLASGTISYNKLLYSSTNIAGTGLDISTGRFTSLFPGSYTVTWGLRVDDNEGDTNTIIYLKMNGHIIKESRHESSTSIGFSRDQGGRTLVLHLARGETLELFCEHCSAVIYDVTFCVSLTTFDIE